LAFGFRSPLLSAARPLRAMSAMFSAFVPANRCAGFTQRRLSQVWQTNNPSGIGPVCIS
jgi:hypothetical protein